MTRYTSAWSETLHKIAPIAQGLFPVKDVNKAEKTAIIEFPDRSVENVSRSRMVCAPVTNITEEVQDAIRLLTINDVILDYPVPENFIHTKTPQTSLKPSSQLPIALETTEQEQPHVDEVVRS